LTSRTYASSPQPWRLQSIKEGIHRAPYTHPFLHTSPFPHTRPFPHTHPSPQPAAAAEPAEPTTNFFSHPWDTRKTPGSLSPINFNTKLSIIRDTRGLRRFLLPKIQDPDIVLYLAAYHDTAFVPGNGLRPSNWRTAKRKFRDYDERGAPLKVLAIYPVHKSDTFYLCYIV
jgi:hypothetical protein